MLPFSSIRVSLICSWLRIIMSPLLLSRPSMFSLRKPAFITQRNSRFRCFSFSPETMIPPFVAFDPQPCGPGVGNLVIVFDHRIWALDKKVPLELVEERGIVGASHGWVATLKDGVVRLQDDLNLSASDLDPKRISLPPLVTLPHCQTQVVTNMAMSCSSPEEDDCVVAIKFLGPQLSLCRPAQSNSEWINIEMQNSSFYSSPVMFSKKDEMFRIPSSGGHLIGSWDLHKHMDKPKLLNVRFRNLPKLTKSMWQLLDSCYRSEHLVESPGGCETFMVKCYRKKTKGLHKMKTKAVMVFKLDEQGNAVYTQDIGDLCIFLSKSEPFCVSTAVRSYFSLVFPNHVYIQDYDEHGSVNIGLPLDASMVVSRHSANPVPYYIPPQSTKYRLRLVTCGIIVEL